MKAANTLDPFAMWPAFPAPNYYGSSAPSRRHQPTTGLPTDQPDASREGDHRKGSHVQCEPIDELGAQLCPCDIATATPQTFTVASLPATFTSPGVPQDAHASGYASLPSPYPPGLSWWE
jgi:hypothetical protein